MTELSCIGDSQTYLSLSQWSCVHAKRPFSDCLDIYSIISPSFCRLLFILAQDISYISLAVFSCNLFKIRSSVELTIILIYIILAIRVPGRLLYDAATSSGNNIKVKQFVF